MQSADFVVPRRRRTCLLTPPQHRALSRYGVRRLRRPSQTKNVSAHSASAPGAIAVWSPPSSSSLADEERVCSLLLSTAARDSGVVFARYAVGLGEESNCRDVDLGTRSSFWRSTLE
jgi:hypothetical protein